MRLQMGRVDHQRVGTAALIGQFEKHPAKDTLLAPALPSAIKGLVRSVLRRRIAPAQTVATDEDYAAQHPPVVYPGLAVGLWEKGSSLAICVALKQYRSLMSPLRFQRRESRSAAEINKS